MNPAPGLHCPHPPLSRLAGEGGCERMTFNELVTEERLLKCIHCGLCLAACPTYEVLSDEADSARGRIWFMRAVAEGRAGLTAEVREHLDRCLACFACETACPSGVRYRDLIEGARAWAGENMPPASPPLWLPFFRNVLTSRKVMRLVSSPAWAARALGLEGVMQAVVRRLPLPWLARAVAILPDRIPSPLEPPHPRVVPARGERRLRVGLQIGCVMDAMFPRLNALFAELLATLGAEVVIPRTQGCCGSLAIHQGERGLGIRQGLALVDAFAGTGVDYVVSTAAGCGAVMKEYGHLLPDGRGTDFAGRVRDVTELVLELAKKRPPVRELRARVAYHEACHMRNAQRLSGPPRELLRSVPGLSLVEVPEQEFCCGSAGVYNILRPDISDELKARKVKAVMSCGVDFITTANPGCLLQMGSGLRGVRGAPKLVHLAEVLAHAWGLGPGLTV